MTVKILIEACNPVGTFVTECKVLHAKNGAVLERRIKDTLSNLKADGYKHAILRDCFNLEYPDIFQRNNAN